ncbi:hypothetical protein [Microbispora sp. KK1-11]|nr:hypothetical protein [Microbispora sp. KK1-11]
MRTATQWPAGADTQKTGKQVRTCKRKKCGAVYTGDHHECRDPEK